MTCRHKRAGIVTTHPNGYIEGEAHAAESTCERPECIAAAIRRVAGAANRTAFYRPDAERAAR